MAPWTDREGRFFSPRLTVSLVPVGPGEVCCVLDNVLANPQGLIDWALEQTFVPPRGYPYPGLVLQAPEAMKQFLAEGFAQHARRRLGGRRTLDASVRFSLISTPPADLQPCQWLCHRDRVSDDPTRLLFAASVLYLFQNPALGGTSFYQPRLPREELDRLLADSLRLDSTAFAARYGLRPSYMTESNRFFERVAQIPAAWNRMIIYNGGLFHSADVHDPELLNAAPRLGRLTLNGFFTCTRGAAG
jgi:hypothetical protein